MDYLLDVIKINIKAKYISRYNNIDLLSSLKALDNTVLYLSTYFIIIYPNYPIEVIKYKYIIRDIV